MTRGPLLVPDLDAPLGYAAGSAPVHISVGRRTADLPRRSLAEYDQASGYDSLIRLPARTALLLRPWARSRQYFSRANDGCASWTLCWNRCLHGSVIRVRGAVGKHYDEHKEEEERKQQGNGQVSPAHLYHRKTRKASTVRPSQRRTRSDRPGVSAAPDGR
jgi:hypothetical protein